MAPVDVAVALARAVAFGVAAAFDFAGAGVLLVRFRAAFGALGSGAAADAGSALAWDCTTARDRLTRGAAEVTGGGVGSGEGEGAD